MYHYTPPGKLLEYGRWVKGQFGSGHAGSAGLAFADHLGTYAHGYAHAAGIGPQFFPPFDGAV